MFLVDSLPCFISGMAINEDALESPLESALDFSVIGVVMLDSRLGALDEAQPSDSCPARLIQVKETSFL